MGRRRRRTARSFAPYRRPLRLEPLEERRMLAVITVTTNSDVVDLADGVISLREAIFVANTVAGHDSIEFDFGHDGPATIVLTEGELVITDSLSITGAGAGLLTIDASGSDPTPDENNGDGSRVFLIDDGVRDNRFTAEIRGMTLTGGDTSDRRGGAIHSREDLTIVECVISGNAVRAMEGQIGGWGGGIQSLYGSLSVVDTTISGNTATISGGAIDFNPERSGGVLVVSGSHLIGNSAGTEGGGILIAGNATITDTTIADNVAASQGGGIAVWQLAEEATILISAAHITGNRTASGGGFFSDSNAALLTVEGTTIDGNVATHVGGGIAMFRSGTLPAGVTPLVIRTSAVTGNTAEVLGGGILIDDMSSGGRGIAASVEGSEVAGNVVIGVGGSAGGIYARTVRLNVSDSHFDDNGRQALVVRGSTSVPSVFSVASTTIRNNDAGIDVRNMTSTVTNSIVTGNQGKGISARYGETTIEGGNFSDNSGSGIYGFSGDLTISNATISSNTSAPRGGGVYSFLGNLTITESTISGNQAADSGGGVFHGSNLTHSLKISGSSIRDNESGRGGGVYTSQYATLTDSIVAGNRAALDGGGIAARNRLVLLQSAVFDNATTGNNAAGGGISALGASDLVLIQDSSVSDNAATGSGGGIHAVATLQVRRSNISGNRATTHGGGIHAPSSNVSLIDSTVSHNRTTGPNAFGGGIVGRVVTITQSTISGNRTEGDISFGGGISATQVNLNQSTVSDNHAVALDTVGGGIRASSTVNLQGSIVAGNTAGGASSNLAVGSIAAANYSLVGSTTGLTAPQLNSLNAGTGNILNEDPLLGPLAYNGGPTFLDGTKMLTHALLPGSPAIDAGDPQANSLVAMYRFEESAGALVADDVVGANDGTYHGAPNLGQAGAPLVGGSAAVFDGVDDYAVIPRAVADNFTFSLWVKTTQSVSGPAGAALVGGDAAASDLDFQLLLFSGRPALRVGNVSIVSSVAINDGNWHHVAATRSATTGAREVYVDGLQRAFASGGMLGTLAAADQLHVGELLSGMGRFAGSIDELGIYDRVLSATEIQQHAAAGVPLFDQRGEPHLRVLDGDEPDDIAIDIGAYERQFGETYNFVVDTLVDESDGDYSLGDFSLREAIELANGNPGADAIEFDAALWAEGPATIVLSLGELSITDAVTIAGPGAQLLTIDASGNDATPLSTLEDGDTTNDGDGSRVFNVDDGAAAAIDVGIHGLTLAGGDAAGDGGAVKSTENLMILECVVRDNIGSHGGGIHSSVGTLNVLRSTVSNNSAFFDGGGIVGLNGDMNVAASTISGNDTNESGGGIEAYVCDLTVIDSTISGNSAGFDGGGIDVVAGSLQIAESTVSDNEAGRHGGGIIGGLTAAAESTKVLTQVTLSGNRAKGMAGGILGGGKTTILHSTIAENVTDSDGTGDGLGGGVSGGFGITVQHSIVANNLNFDVPDDWASEQMPNVDYSLIEHVTGIHPIEGVGNILGQDPLLGPLTGNGGPTFTHALLPGSPAIDAGHPAAVAGMGGVPEFDQRGMPWVRVTNGDDVPEARIDIGAVEWQLNPLAGDYNFNGIVDAADYVVWRNTLGSLNDLRADGSSESTPGAPDGVVDAFDYAWWKTNFGNVLATGSGAGAAEEVTSWSSVLAQQPPALPGVNSGMAAGSLRFDFVPTETPPFDIANTPGKPPAEPGAGGWVHAVDRDEALLALLTRRERGAADVDFDADFSYHDEGPAESAVGTLDEVFAALDRGF